ncbi:hypothetical protein CFOL_v3_32666 [Cephalotus follicularis]|uniref:Zf-RVT domain-containing protein n=1 Tax=Cephalotus follicularis TaxID=3775 RepID=A0A1Q3DAF2_CEPFO|nr:hypothetical protein CFOL_v3_32666 [Cephalotus follicularis]
MKEWNEKFLSKAGKEILIKAVVQSIPSYVMSVFKLPKNLYDDLTRLIRRFWWSQKENECKIHCMDWKRLCFKENPSMIWKSFNGARKVIEKGMCWRVGDGKSIQIWKCSGFLGWRISLAQQTQTCYWRMLKINRIICDIRTQ